MGRTFWFDDWWPIEAIGFLGLVVFVLAVIGLLRNRALRRGARRSSAWRSVKSAAFGALATLGFLALACTAGFLFLFGSYHTLTEWEVVARAAAGERGSLRQFDFEYTTLARGKDRATRHYEVYGDRWAIRADFVQWKPWLRRFGYERSFKLTHLKGLYDREQDYLERPVTSLTLGRGSDRLWLRAHSGHIPLLYRPFVQAVYTSSLSQVPRPGERYDIVGAKTGLGLRKINY